MPSTPHHPQPPFTIRPATLSSSDHDLLVDFQESQLPWLSTIGSAAQWGTVPIRDSNPTAALRTRSWVEKSEQASPFDPINPSTNNPWCRAYIAESPSGVALAGMVLDSKAPAYVADVLPGQDEKDPFVYLAYLISNRDAGGERRGAAGGLIEFAKGVVGGEGVERICVDCWRGNDRKLVRYYESQGFKVLGDFTAGEKEWPGCVLEMRL